MAALPQLRIIREGNQYSSSTVLRTVSESEWLPDVLLADAAQAPSADLCPDVHYPACRRRLLRSAEKLGSPALECLKSILMRANFANKAAGFVCKTSHSRCSQFCLSAQE